LVVFLVAVQQVERPDLVELTEAAKRRSRLGGGDVELPPTKGRVTDLREPCGFTKGIASAFTLHLQALSGRLLRHDSSPLV
jgi:hypothetical protein